MNNFFNPFLWNKFPRPNYLPPPKFQNKTFNNFQNLNISSKKDSEQILEKKSTEKPLFEIYGIKLFSDDLLILALIFFLYKENINDTLLLIALFSLLF